MHGLSPSDGDRKIDWGRTSVDYSVFRPGPPPSFYERLAALKVGVAGQRILDLGTGTGVLARQFARQGCTVHGIDIAPNQVATATRLAEEEGLTATFEVRPAENLPWRESAFDLATANQCWLYFDKRVVIAELRRILVPGGRLVTSHYSWMPRLDKIARQSEELVLQHNPSWTAGDWDGVIPEFPAWAVPFFEVEASFVYDEPIPFTRDSWAGRIRACRGVGATMTPAEVEAFDAAHAALLQRIAPEEFTVLHRLDAHIFVFKPETSQPD